MRLGILSVVAVITVSILAALIAAEAQAGKVYRIGVLLPFSASDGARYVEAFRQGLREAGDVEGQNIALELRYTDRSDGMPDLAAELVRLNVDIILAPNNASIGAVQRVTSTIPIVM